MAATPESKVKAQVKKILDEFGAYYFFPVTGGFGKSGVPDIIACYKGYFIGIECKAGKGVPTALQLRELARIKENEGAALVVNENNLNDVTLILEAIDER